jgi:hypothetical protein
LGNSQKEPAVRVLKELVGTAALIAALAAFGTAPSSASTITLQTATNGGGTNQAYSGLGLEFTVDSAISITALGIYNSAFNGNITGPLTADVMTTDGVVKASYTFEDITGGTIVSGGYLFQSITPVTLAPGNYYLMGYGWTATDGEHNSNISGNPDIFNGGGLVTFVKSVFGNGGDPAGSLPTNLNYPGNNIDWFSAANIQFSATPLPATWLMLFSGFVGLGYFAYRGSKKSAGAIAAV